jgi:teichuronic acid biosynthesis glycosyltransferase TuaG
MTSVNANCINNLVSIIMPAYMAADFIADAIESVIIQDYSYWELIIVDDGSSDGTSDVVRSYCESDQRVRLIVQKNSGPAVARQVALKFSRGQFIAFLDSDDIWLHGKLSLQLKFMQDNACGFSFTEYRRMTLNCSKVGYLIKIPDYLNYKKLLSNTAIATSTVILDRFIVEDIKIQDTYYDDYVLWLSLLRSGVISALGFHADLMRYRVVTGSVSRNKLRSSVMVWRIYRNFEKLDILTSAWHFFLYSINAFIKYRNF